MGGFFTKMFSKLSGKKELKIIIIGLDNSGKTTILNKLHLNQVKQTVPSNSLINIQQLDSICKLYNIKIQNSKFGIQEDKTQQGTLLFKAPRQYWQMYYPSTNAILYVVDSKDKQRFAKSSQQLSKVLNKQILQGVPLLVLANKQDLPDSAPQKQISQVLGLSKIKNRDWSIYKCSAVTGVGLNQSMDWLVQKLANNN